jgi:hypothetical protein
LTIGTHPRPCAHRSDHEAEGLGQLVEQAASGERSDQDLRRRVAAANRWHVALLARSPVGGGTPPDHPAFHSHAGRRRRRVSRRVPTQPLQTSVGISRSIKRSAKIRVILLAGPVGRIALLDDPRTPLHQVGFSAMVAMSSAGARDMARQIASSWEGRTARRLRKKVEMLFAHLKRILRLDRLWLRGPNGARDEFLLAATDQNVRKLAKLITSPSQPLPRGVFMLCGTGKLT